MALLEMAKGKYQKWLEDENLLLMQGWKRNGLTDEQIAHNMGISINTLNKWKRRFGQIRQALKIGREQSNFIVENALFQKAVKGHVTAQIFWLKNNWRDKYNDSQLSVEERELLKHRIKDSELDTKIKEAKLKILQSEGANAEDHLLELIEAIEKEDDKEHGTDRGINS